MHYIDEITHFIGTDQICSFVLVYKWVNGNVEFTFTIVP